jgi:glycosyltransferase involved in cell wall biosynthesis
MLAGRTSAVIAVSAQTAREYGDMFAATAPKLVVIPNGIPRAVAPRIGFAAEPTRFLALSRIHPQKDIETMIRGFDRFLAESSVSAELAIAGAFDVSDYETKVRLVHRDLAFRDRIRFLGSRNDVLDLLANSDVFVHTALFEAHSISILEAAAGALPIVASDLPSIRESIGSRAEYFRPGDAEGLSDALHRTVGSWPAPAQVAHELARVVNSRYSMLACANAHLEVIGAAARSRGSLGSRGS